MDKISNKKENANDNACLSRSLKRERIGSEYEICSKSVQRQLLRNDFIKEYMDFLPDRLKNDKLSKNSKRLKFENEQNSLWKFRRFRTPEIHCQKSTDIVDLSNQNNNQEQQAILQEFTRKQQARSLAIPTDDSKVRQRLREIGEPRTLFAELNVDRRERLREIISKRPELEFLDNDSSSGSDSEIQEEFFTYGSELLLEARRNILDYSIPKAQDRIKSQKEEYAVDLAARKKIRFEWFNYLKGFETKTLQFGDDRPLGFCLFSPNSKLLATASFSGLIKLWTVPESNHVFTLKGHKDRVSGLDFHPLSTISQSRSSLNLVSGGLDGSVNLWSFDNENPIGALKGHQLRVSKAVFHPSGKFIGTCSFDTTWRLWDAETSKELLLQEGHSRQLFGIAFQGDGSLVATGGMDNLARIWDLRTGRSVMVLKGHVKSILSLDWNPNGYNLATGSEDHTIRIWDVRSAASTYTVPAHTSIITQVKYFKAGNSFETKSETPYTFAEENNSDMEVVNEFNDSQEHRIRKQVLNGSFLVSSSYDGTCKIWTDGDFKPLKSMTGLEGKITCCDISNDAKYVATSLYDRTFKIFSHQ